MDQGVSKRRLRTSYISTIVSITLVLFILGLAALMILHARKLSNHVKENIGISVFLKDEVKEVDIKKLQKSLDAVHYIKSTRYINKETAADELKGELGEDFISFLGYNPLLSSIDIHLIADYAVEDSIIKVENQLMDNPLVKEVYYQKNLVSLINDNVKKITVVLIAFGAALLLIAIALINSSIRLTIYSRRFIIKTMQLVGATHWFIRRPFVFQGMAHGVIGSIIAIGMMIFVIFQAQKQFPDFFNFRDAEMIAALFGIILLLGILITWICTIFAVRKYLRIKTSVLY